MEEARLIEAIVRRWLPKLMVLTVMALPVALAYLAFAFAPLSITCSQGGLAPCETSPVRLLGGFLAVRPEAEVQVLLFIGLMGGLGGFAAALGGKGRRTEQGLAVWLRLHISSTAMGALVALAFYTVIRTGAFSPNSDLSSINVLGLAVLALAAGYCAPAVTARLEAMAGLLFEDAGSSREIASAIQRLDDRLESTLAKPVLDNWKGAVAVIVLASGTRQLIPGNGRRSALQPGEPVRCIVHFLAQGEDRPELTEHAFMDRIEIRSGNPEPASVTFDVAVDGSDFDFQTERATWTSWQYEEALVFDGTAPNESGEHKLYVTVAQKGRLIQSILVLVSVPAPKKRRREPPVE
jgi:hypothetical protein